MSQTPTPLRSSNAERRRTEALNTFEARCQNAKTLGYHSKALKPLQAKAATENPRTLKDISISISAISKSLHLYLYLHISAISISTSISPSPKDGRPHSSRDGELRKAPATSRGASRGLRWGLGFHRLLGLRTVYRGFGGLM